MPGEENIQTDQPLEEIDLIAAMQEATDYKPEFNRPDPISAVALEPDAEFAPEEQAPVPEEEKTEEINVEELTDLVIEGSSFLMEQMFPGLYRSAMPKEDLKVMRAVAKKYRLLRESGKKTIDFSEEDSDAIEIFDEYEEYCKDLPLTANEKSKLRTPLQKVLATVNFKATPENALIAVAAMILLPRVAPLITKKFIP